ncbi:hypothetical protein LCGC14_0617430 [marine sediment metagenome]|uniref:HIT domain-containing protein n=1 Tax=marine sediment metagenome TaxID=412755 RepID=A0A0F9RQ46_9ZZZZ
MQALGKIEYVQGKKRPDVDCILCAIKDDDKRVINLKYYEDDLIFIILNLYPYNPAHSMIIPNRHIFKFTDLTKDEIQRIFRAVQGLQNLIGDIYNPRGYNIGFNQGNAGASIPHLHCHLVPRYGTELGFIDIVGETRVVPEGLESVKKKLENNIQNFLNKQFFESF